MPGRTGQLERPHDPSFPFCNHFGALFSDQREGNNSDSEYGLIPPTKSKPATQLVAPTRFTKGTALSEIAATKGSVQKKVLETGPEEERLDPQEIVRRQIEEELLMEFIANDVVEDMDLGEWDYDPEDSLPTDEEYLQGKANGKYGSSYYSAQAVSPQRLDRIADSVTVFGADLFVPGSRWGIKRRKN